MTRVLVVDDNVELAENLVDIFDTVGIDAVAVSNAEAALRLVATEHFDCMLLDVRMPGMDGVSLGRILRDAAPSACVMLMTAFASDDRLAAARSAGIEHVLGKPFTAAHVLDTMQACLARSA